VREIVRDADKNVAATNEQKPRNNCEKQQQQKSTSLPSLAASGRERSLFERGCRRLGVALP
jgi:hypothetical protein